MPSATDPRGQQPTSRRPLSSPQPAASRPAGKRFKQPQGQVRPVPRQTQQSARQAQSANRAQAAHPVSRNVQPRGAQGARSVAPASRSSYSGARRRAPQKRRSKLPVIIGALVAVLAIAAIVLLAVPAVSSLFGGGGEKVVAGQAVTVTIPDGASGDAIASLLSENHVVENPKDYYAAVKKLNADMSLKPGTYSFTTGMDAQKVVQQLMEGPNASGSLTIPEGLTVDQVADRVAQAYDSITADDFKAQAKASNYVSDYAFLADAADDSLEGFLCPKTYDLGSSPSADAVIRAMLDQYKTEAASLDFKAGEAAIKERYGVEMSDYDIISLASIVEREGLNAGQRAHVASVFYNRLAGKMPGGLRYLNSDATMMYVTGGEVTAEDLQQDSPYNSYKHEGLPPTPICSPSLEAIKATLNPTDSDDLYFYITQDEEYFSQTYEEHQQSWN